MSAMLISTLSSTTEANDVNSDYDFDYHCPDTLHAHPGIFAFIVVTVVFSFVHTVALFVVTMVKAWRLRKHYFHADTEHVLVFTDTYGRERSRVEGGAGGPECDEVHLENELAGVEEEGDADTIVPGDDLSQWYDVMPTQVEKSALAHSASRGARQSVPFHSIPEEADEEADANRGGTLKFSASAASRLNKAGDKARRSSSISPRMTRHSLVSLGSVSVVSGHTNNLAVPGHPMEPHSSLYRTNSQEMVDQMSRFLFTTQDVAMFRPTAMDDRRRRKSSGTPEWSRKMSKQDGSDGTSGDASLASSVVNGGRRKSASNVQTDAPEATPTSSVADADADSDALSGARVSSLSISSPRFFMHSPNLNSTPDIGRRARKRSRQMSTDSQASRKMNPFASIALGVLNSRSSIDLKPGLFDNRAATQPPTPPCSTAKSELPQTDTLPVITLTASTPRIKSKELRSVLAQRDSCGSVGGASSVAEGQDHLVLASASSEYSERTLEDQPERRAKSVDIRRQPNKGKDDFRSSSVDFPSGKLAMLQTATARARAAAAAAAAAKGSLGRSSRASRTGRSGSTTSDVVLYKSQRRQGITFSQHNDQESTYV